MGFDLQPSLGSVFRLWEVLQYVSSVSYSLESEHFNQASNLSNINKEVLVGAAYYNDSLSLYLGIATWEMIKKHFLLNKYYNKNHEKNHNKIA
jgi:hypothetical protein